MEGYFDSDGAKTQGLYKITTVSPKLVYSAAQAISKVYHRPVSVYTTKRPSTCVIEGRIVNQRDTYQLTFKPNANKQDKAFYEDGYIWFPIRSVTNTHEMKDVYDITVEAHHSFVANNCMAHNCQDISVAGKMAGIVEGETRSGLLFEALRIIKTKKPKYAIAENVKNLVGKKFKADFDNVLNILDSYGYNNYWKVLNAKDYGIPQNRERVFVISIRKDIDNGTFKFPEKFPLELKLKDMLEDEVDDKFYLTPKQIKCLNVNEPKGTDILHVGNTKSGGQKSDIISAAGISSCLNATDYKQPKQIVSPAYESVTRVNDNYAMLNGGKIGKMHDISRRAYYEDSVAPTIHTRSGGNQEPKVIVSERMYRQAFETLDENDCKAGDVINPYNKKVVADGTCPTLTTRPEGFKTANLVVTDQQIVDSIPDSNSYNKRKAQEMLDKKGYLPEFHVPYNNQEVKEISPTLTTCSGHFEGSGSVMYKHDSRISKLTKKE